MTIAESEERPAEGDKPEGVRGRTTTTVRFTAARLADLRAAAAEQGRSLSEEIEHRIEAHAQMQELLGQLHDHQTLISNLQQQVRALKEESRSAKENVAMDDERAARIAAAAIAAYTGGRK
jgi:hypothetical protein